MIQTQTIKCNDDKQKPVRINEGQEKGNTRTVTTQRPNVQPAPQKPVETERK